MMPARVMSTHDTPAPINHDIATAGRQNAHEKRLVTPSGAVGRDGGIEAVQPAPLVRGRVTHQRRFDDVVIARPQRDGEKRVREAEDEQRARDEEHEVSQRQAGPERPCDPFTPPG